MGAPDIRCLMLLAEGGCRSDYQAELVAALLTRSARACECVLNYCLCFVAELFFASTDALFESWFGQCFLGFFVRKNVHAAAECFAQFAGF
jgi:hypothetical protein